MNFKKLPTFMHRRQLRSLLVGSRTGAVPRRPDLSVPPRFLWECLTSQAVGPFPAPASSHAACRFPALRAPAHFTSRVMGPITPAPLSARVHDEPYRLLHRYQANILALSREDGSAFALTYILRRRSCRSMGAFIISPPPPRCTETS